MEDILIVKSAKRSILTTNCVDQSKFAFMLTDVLEIFFTYKINSLTYCLKKWNNKFISIKKKHRWNKNTEDVCAFSIRQFDNCAVHRTKHNFQKTYKDSHTVKTILEKLKNEININGTPTTLSHKI